MKVCRELLQEECNKLYKEDLRAFALYCLNEVPEHFWIKPASSTGKYHFPDENEEGGLALHTVRVCKVAQVLVTAKNTVDLDAVRLACIFHDVGRYGLKEEPEKWSLKEHPELSAGFFQSCISQYTQWFENTSTTTLERATAAIRSHMGRWGTVKPEAEEDWIVHLADMIASQYKP